MKEISEQLIQQFFNNQCRPEQAVQVEAYLIANPEELEKYISIHSLLTDETGTTIDTDISKKMLSRIEKGISKKSGKTVRLNWMKYAAAASLTGLMVFTSIKYRDNANNSNAYSNVIQQQVQFNSPVSNLKTMTNNTNKVLVISLQDGSSVCLFPKGILQFFQPFTNNKRQLFLAGTAFFKVAKDKTKPFIVTTDGLSTTAVGTSFTIVCEKKSNNITVQLYTGKVMVSKAANSSCAFSTKYLLPGQQLKVNKTTYASESSAFKIKDNDAKIEKESIAANHENLLNFKQTGLSQIFASLENRYKITIAYNISEVANMKFTGRFNTHEDVASILNNIAELNGFTVTKTNTGFEIKK